MYVRIEFLPELLTESHERFYPTAAGELAAKTTSAATPQLCTG